MTQADTIVRLYGLPRVPSLDRRQVLVTGEQGVPGLGALWSVALRFWRAFRRFFGHIDGLRTASADRLNAEPSTAGLVRALATHHDPAGTLSVTSADRIRQEMALARLERVMELATSAGIEVHAVQLPNGGIGISVDGSGLKSVPST